MHFRFDAQPFPPLQIKVSICIEIDRLQSKAPESFGSRHKKSTPNQACLATPRGFEPRPTEPKSVVLPLH